MIVANVNIETNKRGREDLATRLNIRTLLYTYIQSWEEKIPRSNDVMHSVAFVIIKLLPRIEHIV